MIVVMGASGRVGGAALDGIVQAGRKVRALSRSPRTDKGDAVEWVAADAGDVASMSAAFAGAEAVFVLNPVAIDADDVFKQARRLSRERSLPRSSLRRRLMWSRYPRKARI